MKKKYAMMIMGTQYDTQSHQAAFETGSLTTYIFTVKNFEEAKQRALQCVEEGFGAIELCGAFGLEKTGALIAATDNKIAIGYVVSHPEQGEMLGRFFASCPPNTEDL